MSQEWMRATWAFQPITLSHTFAHIMRAIDDALTAAGWARASWSNGGAVSTADNYYVRSDRYRVDLNSTSFGPSGNQSIAFSSGVVTKSDMAGGAFAIGGSSKAAGWIALSGLPTDGDTITITDGTTTAVLEFDNNSSVASGHVPVVIGASVENTLENFATAVGTVTGLLITATPHWQWWYTGDNNYQHCGIHVHYNSAGPNIQIGSFLENVTHLGLQISVVPTFPITLAYDVTQENDFLFIFGEDGFYLECGTGGLNNNVAHGMICAFYPDPTLYGTRDRERTWAAQGMTYDLHGTAGTAGAIRNSGQSRQNRFVETVSDRRNHTAFILGRVARGTPDTVNQTPADNLDLFFGPREHLLTAPANENQGTLYFYFTLGLIQSNFDDLYRISNLAIMQGLAYACNASNSGSQVTGTTGLLSDTYYDMRNAMRQVPKFGVCSSYELPWNNVTDKRTGFTYRIAQVADTGRNSNVAVIWPDSGNVVTIPTTP